MAAAEALKNKQLQELEQKNRDEIRKVSAEAAEEIELMKTMHDEALEITN